MRTNWMKKKLSEGKPVIGTWNTMTTPLVTRVLAASGFDFVVLDFEHGPMDLSVVHAAVSAAESYQCSVITRVPENAAWMVLQSLDQGSHGIMVPHIDTEEDTKKLVEYSKYAPIGNRGFTPFTTAGEFTALNIQKHSEMANDFTLNCVIIESLEGLNNVEKIASIPNIDVVYFGAYDLSHALGFSGQTRHEKVVSKIKEAVQVVNKHGKAAGGFVAMSPEDIDWLLNMGMKFITYEVDSHLIHRPAQQITSWFHQEKTAK